MELINISPYICYANFKTTTMALIKTLDDLTPSMREFINQYYNNENDFLVGLFPCTEDGYYEAHRVAREKLKELQKQGGWEKDEKVNDREIEYISIRCDHCDDSKGRVNTEGMEYMEKINACAPYFFYVCSIARRFKNPLNGVYTYDDEINGATPIKLH